MPLVCLLLLLGMVGCGSEGSSGTAETSRTGADEGTAKQAKAPVQEKPPKGPSREFFIPGGDNIVQQFGHEGTAAERREISAVITIFMRARAAGDWAAECRHLHWEAIRWTKSLASTETGRDIDTCPEAARIVTESGPPKSRANPLPGPADSLRIAGNQAFGQYHGRQGRDWVVGVKKQEGNWKLLALDPAPR